MIKHDIQKTRREYGYNELADLLGFGQEEGILEIFFSDSITGQRDGLVILTEKRNKNKCTVCGAMNSSGYIFSADCNHIICKECEKEGWTMDKLHKEATKEFVRDIYGKLETRKDG